MTYARLFLPVVLAALLLSACGGAGNAITFKLDPRHRSGLDAVAELAPRHGGSRLTIELGPGADPPRGTTAAVYRGSCATIPQQPISRPTRIGQDELSVVVGSAADSLSRGDHSVVLERGGVMLACGDVPAGARR